MYYILDTNFDAVKLVDSYESIIWTDRAREYGDFELTCFPDDEIRSFALPDYYLYNSESEHLMIIEGQEITTDIEEGDRLLITGRSLESILLRRIVWGQTTINGSFQDGIETLFNNNIINPSDSDRLIDNFIMSKSEETAITELTLDAQYMGEDLYTIIKENCDKFKINFKIVLNSNNQFVFSFYISTNRSYSQEINPYVIFSPNFDNIINSQYYKKQQDYKNVTLIGGEGNGTERILATTGTASGLIRREIFTDARDVSSEDDNGNRLSPEQYQTLLINKGKENLNEYKIDEMFDGEVEASKTFVFGKDFNLGDILQVENEYGMSGSSFVSEIIWSEDSDGKKTYPTFVAITEDDEEGEGEGEN